MSPTDASEMILAKIEHVADEMSALRNSSSAMRAELARLSARDAEHERNVTRFWDVEFRGLVEDLRRAVEANTSNARDIQELRVVFQDRLAHAESRIAILEADGSKTSSRAAAAGLVAAGSAVAQLIELLSQLR